MKVAQGKSSSEDGTVRYSALTPLRPKFPFETKISVNARVFKSAIFIRKNNTSCRSEIKNYKLFLSVCSLYSRKKLIKQTNKQMFSYPYIKYQ